jgi:sugar phosphate isomerase/epimerase
MPPALQLYTVRHQLAEDFAGTLRRVRDVGYQAVETYPFPSQISAAMAAEIFNDLGLEVVAMHCDLPVGHSLSEVLETASHLRCRRVIWHGWPRSSEHDSVEGVQRLAVLYNNACAVARKHGLQFGLHNHWWEFEPINGLYPYRMFQEILDPDVFLEIDVYWVRTAGLDPASIIAELETPTPRIQFLHLKDGPAAHGETMTALGEGVLDIPSALNAVNRPIQLVVELDECAGDICEAIRRSLLYLQRVA